jgi:glycosyltransferase involved in cell wall biosynthesis
VISTWWETAEWVASYPADRGRKACFLQQYEANFGQPEERVAASWRLPLRKIVCSRWLADLARERFGDPHAAVVGNGVGDFFDAPPRGRQPQPTVGVMYSTSQAKSWATVLAALLEIRRQLPDLCVLGVGIDRPAPFLPVPGFMTLAVQPDQERIRELYRRCDLWLCGSSSEGFHLPPHEAMACRCPVVSTRVGGPMDLVVEGSNGWLSEPFDAAELARQAVRVLTLPEAEWRRFSDHAYQTARRRTWDHAAADFEAALTS